MAPSFEGVKEMMTLGTNRQNDGGTPKRGEGSKKYYMYEHKGQHFNQHKCQFWILWTRGGHAL